MPIQSSSDLKKWGRAKAEQLVAWWRKRLSDDKRLAPQRRNTVKRSAVPNKKSESKVPKRHRPRRILGAGLLPAVTRPALRTFEIIGLFAIEIAFVTGHAVLSRLAAMRPPVKPELFTYEQLIAALNAQRTRVGLSPVAEKQIPDPERLRKRQQSHNGSGGVPQPDYGERIHDLHPNEDDLSGLKL